LRSRSSRSWGFVAVPASVLAVVSGSVGISRVERGLATNPGWTRLGIGLGVAAGFMTLLVFVATSDIASCGVVNSLQCAPQVVPPAA
jgi:hypothetical protein